MDSDSAMKTRLVFSGEDDPYGWILKADKYFTLHEVKDGDEKVGYASLCMEGKALNWLKLMEAKKPIHGWEMFKHELMKRFGTKGTSSAYEQLFSLRQSKNTTVADYREQFESIIAPIITYMSDDEKLIRAFVNGLKDYIKVGVLESMKSRDLVGVMSLAQEIEDNLKIGEICSRDHIKTASSKFRGKIGSREVIVLIDVFGHGYNLISKKVVTDLQIPVVKTKTGGFLLRGIGGGSDELVSEECERVVLKMCGLEMALRLYAINNLDMVDVVLGNEWSRLLDDSSCTYEYLTNSMTVTFKLDGITIQFESM